MASIKNVYLQVVQHSSVTSGDMKQCRLVDRYQYSGGVCCLHFRDIYEFWETSVSVSYQWSRL